jgi:tRNA (cytidine/uridine-2'-O-)-methyltransferase
MELVLVHPEIPHNTGCAARLAAALGLRLHLIEPLGFKLEDRYLKRAGLDYWPMVDLHVHANWAAAAKILEAGSTRPLQERMRMFSARGGTSLFESRFEGEDILVFGSESGGLPAALLASYPNNRIYIPIHQGVRSLNLANVVCLGAYTAMVAAGQPLPANAGGYLRDDRADLGLQPEDIAQSSSLPE